MNKVENIDRDLKSKQERRREREHTGLLGLAVRPLGNGKMNLLAAENFGFVRILETVPDQIGANVRVGDVCHPRRSPKGHCCIRSHFSATFFLSFFSVVSMSFVQPICNKAGWADE